MNFIHIAGHLGADPEVRFTSDGKKVTTLRVACRTRVKGNDDTIWYRVTIWGDRFDKMIPYFKKGSSVIVMGDFHKPEIFQDREGKSQISLEITAVHLQFSPFGKPAEKEGTSSHPQTQTESSALNPYMPNKTSLSRPIGETIDDEVPF